MFAKKKYEAANNMALELNFIASILHKSKKKKNTHKIFSNLDLNYKAK